MEKNKRLIINVLLVAILVVIAIGRSYSYLSVNDSSNAKPENLKLQNGDINIAFSGSNTIEFSSPKAKNTPVVSKTFTLYFTNVNNISFQLSYLKNSLAIISAVARLYSLYLLTIGSISPISLMCFCQSF